MPVRTHRAGVDTPTSSPPAVDPKRVSCRRFLSRPIGDLPMPPQGKTCHHQHVPPLPHVLVAAGLALALMTGCGARPRLRASPVQRASIHFLANYVNREGAVIRYGQGADVVSEGQAYGMIIAELAGRPEPVRTIWAWTKRHLLMPDGLLAYHATAAGARLSDQSATDADTLAAFALLRYVGPGASAMHRAGEFLAAAILRGESVSGPSKAPLLTAGPWANGPPTIVNPSYWMPGVYEQLATLTGNERWAAAAAAAIQMVRNLTESGRFLPPDWAEVDGKHVEPIPAPGSAGVVQYGLDAQRVPVFFASSCELAGRQLASAWWTRYLEGNPSRDSAIALSPTGVVLDSATNPLPLVAAAASAHAAGDLVSAQRLLSLARATARRFPTYYGDAWVAMGPALLSGLLGRC